MNENLSLALKLAGKGVRVCGVKPDTKMPYKGTAGVPAGTSKTAGANQADIKAFWVKYPKAVPAAVGGSKLADETYLSFLDIDPANKAKQTPEENRAAAERIAVELETKYPGITKCAMRES